MKNSNTIEEIVITTEDREWAKNIIDEATEPQKKALKRNLELWDIEKAKNKFLETIENKEIKDIVEKLITMRIEKWIMWEEAITKLYKYNKGMSCTDVDESRGYPWTIFYREVRELEEAGKWPFKDWWSHNHFGDYRDKN